ncbi:hypothetical protein [Mycobacterium sp.]
MVRSWRASAPGGVVVNGGSGSLIGKSFGQIAGERGLHPLGPAASGTEQA